MSRFGGEECLDLKSAGLDVLQDIQVQGHMGIKTLLERMADTTANSAEEFPQRESVGKDKRG